ncbi:hypothetical protein ACHAPT_009668 [Fusarium lateritium]
MSYQQSYTQLDAAAARDTIGADVDEPRHRSSHQRVSYRPGESRTGRFFSIWLPLYIHQLLCLTILLFTAIFTNGYHALAYPEQSRRQKEGLVLRASDITTLLSLATKIMDYFRLSWTGMVAWRVAFILLESQGLSVKHLSRYLWGVPALKWPLGKEWLVAVLFLLLIPQPFIEPLFLGSLDWSFATSEGVPITVASADPSAGARGWFWYLEKIGNRRIAIRTAGGMASRAWGAEDLQRPEDGRSGSCRHVMPGIAPINSTLLNATLPCIHIHSITWATGPVPNETAIYAREKVTKLSLVDDPPFHYTRSGVAVLFSPGDTWDTPSLVKIDRDNTKADFPEATKWTGNMIIFLTLNRQKTVGCQTIAPNAFGNSTYFDGDSLRAFPAQDNPLNETCIAWGSVHFTAGVVKAARSKFVTPQVIEYDPAAASGAGTSDAKIAEAIQPSVWTREALWLMPDTMTQVAVMNTSQLPTWENLDNFTATLIRTSYLANWDMLHAMYDDKDTVQLTLLPAQPRLRASVSSIRLYSWYAATLLLPVTGVILKYLHRSCKRGILADQTALLFSDTSEVTKEHPDLTGMTALTKRDDQLKPMFMKQVEPGQAMFRIGFGKSQQALSA